MQAVSVDPVSKIIGAQGGFLWADVDVAYEHGLATVGGTVNHTGMGGGYGWLSGEHGLTIDTLLAVQIVLADGSIPPPLNPKPQTSFGPRGEAMVFANRGQQQNVLASPNWTDPAHDEVCMAWAREMGSSLTWR